MANDTILTPGGDHWEEPTEVVDNENYFEIPNCLSELESEEAKAAARENLGINLLDLFTLEEAAELKKEINKKLASENFEWILTLAQSKLEEALKDLVRTDGTTPFKSPLKGVDGSDESTLTTLKFVNSLLLQYKNEINNIIENIKNDILFNYVKSNDVYDKESLYTKLDIDNLNKLFIRKDGTTPFTKALIGIDPQLDSHLSTKRYVDNKVYKHETEIDPHGFISILNNRLVNYAKIANVYDKTQTYSRILIDLLINSLVQDAANDALLDHINQYDPHHILDKVRSEKYVKLDGSVPFLNPLKSVPAVEDDDLITLKLLKANQPIWKTSGPVESTVGHVRDNSELPAEMTMQEILDAIFYGKSIDLVIDDSVNLGDSCEVTVCIHGSLALVEYAELYLNGKLIYTFQPEDFEETGCITVQSDLIFEDTEFEFKVYYINGNPESVKKTVTVDLPVFIGSLPKWKFANTISWEYLLELKREDLGIFTNEENLVYKFNFLDSTLRHPFIVVPASFPPLRSMVTECQRFGIDDFDIIDAIPLHVPGAKNAITYTIYVYRQAIFSLTQQVTFKFDENE